MHHSPAGNNTTSVRSKKDQQSAALIVPIEMQFASRKTITGLKVAEVPSFSQAVDTQGLKTTRLH
jgi:hypothetical protein